ncbi:UNVERIFIED_CONTAM: hypothetical protein GTU68_018133, partial [Idotea baltica]|nr:hypothetical protein [Idotea baltica]
MNSSSLSDKRIKIILSACLCFGAGVLMATVFLHILSETRESFLAMMDEGIIKDTEYPLTELVLCLGFFLIYFVEEIVHSCVNYNQHKRHEDDLEGDFSSHKNSISVKSFKKSHDSFRIKKDLAASNNKDANQMENNNFNSSTEDSCTCANTNQI